MNSAFCDMFCILLGDVQISAGGMGLSNFLVAFSFYARVSLHSDRIQTG